MTSDKFFKQAGGKFICGFDGLTVNDHLLKLIHVYHVGGIILFTRNINTYDQVKALTQNIREEAKKADYQNDILIAIDQENGLVNRLSGMDFYLPGAMSLGAADNGEMSYEVGRRTGGILRDFSINLNLAPVLDLNTNPNNPGVGTRSFSDDPERVFRNADKFIKGQSEYGILNTIKHFPGLGELSVDTHFDLPEVNKTIADLKDLELIPFQKIIAANPVALMTAHIRFPKIDPSNMPGTMSKAILTDLVRGEMGFDGVIITDCLEMHAISKNYGVAEGAKKAVLAGADMAIVSHHLEEQEKAIKALAETIENNEISAEIIKKSKDRMEKFIARSAVKIGEPYDYNYEYSDIYKQTVTVLKNEALIGENPIFLVPYDERRAVGENDKDNREQVFKGVVREKYADALTIDFTNDNLSEKLSELSEKYQDSDIVIGTLSNKFDGLGDLDFSNNLHIIALRDPYPNDVLYKKAKTWINTYDLNKDVIEIALKRACGEIKTYGTLPVKKYFR